MFAKIQAVEMMPNHMLTTQSVAKLVAQFIVNAFDARLSQI